MRLAEKADVVVEAFRPGVAERLGVGYRQIAARAPHIVYASISAFGQSGPYRDIATPRSGDRGDGRCAVDHPWAGRRTCHSRRRGRRHAVVDDGAYRAC